MRETRSEKGQTLLLMDKTGFASDLGEIEAKELALQAAVTRLQTEASNSDATEVTFPEELRIEGTFGRTERGSAVCDPT